MKSSLAMLLSSVIAGAPAVETDLTGPPEVAQLAAIRVAGVDVADDRAVLPRLTDGGLEDVTLAAWNLPASTGAFILVEDGAEWHAFGPAVDEGRGIMRVSAVPLGPHLARGRRVRIRAVATAARLERGQIVPASAIERTFPRSLVVEVTVHERLATAPGDCDVRLQQADRRTLSEEEPSLLPAIASFSGRFRCADEKRAQPFFYLARNCGPDLPLHITEATFVDDKSFAFNAVDLSSPAPRERYWCTVQAIASAVPLRAGPTWLVDWRTHQRGASPLLQAVIEARRPVIVRPLDVMTIDEITLTGGARLRVTKQRRLERPFGAAIVLVQGQLDRVREGEELFLLVRSETSAWIVVGPAIIDGRTWRVFVDPLAGFGTGADRHLQILAATAASLPRGTLAYEEWAHQVSGLSEAVHVEGTGTPPRAAEPPTVTLDAAALPVAASRKITGDAGGLPPGARSYVTAALKLPSRSDWLTTQSVVIAGDGHWWLMAPPAPEWPLGEPGAQLLVVLTRAPIAANSISHSRLLAVAVASTEPISVTGTDTSLASTLKGAVMPTLATAAAIPLAIACVALSCLLWLAYHRRRSAPPEERERATAQANRWGRVLGDGLAALRAKLPWLSIPTNSHWAIIGIALGIVIFIAIAQYAPVYSHALARVFPQSRSVADRITFMLITFTGSAGVLIHAASRSKGGGMYLMKLVLLVTTPAAWAFSAYVYYCAHQGDGNQMAAMALAVAIFLGNTIETLGLYVAFRLGGALAAWIVAQLFIVPLSVLVAVLTGGLPRRPPASVVAKGEPS